MRQEQRKHRLLKLMSAQTQTDTQLVLREQSGLVIRGLWSAADSRALRLACSLMTLTHLSPQCPFPPREKHTDKHTGHTRTLSTQYRHSSSVPFELTLEGTENKKDHSNWERVHKQRTSYLRDRGLKKRCNVL